MSESLKKHINRFVKISDDEFTEIINHFKLQRFKKKENLLIEGKVCKASYFVTKGILRKFFINEKGVEQTTEFAIENWWMTENFSLINQSPSEFFIQAVENTDILVLHRDAQEKMLDVHPLMEKYFRCVYERAFAAAQRRNKFRYEHSREELYHFFRKVQPEFLQRVPQYLIASYLGFTPEYLSESGEKAFLKPV